MVIFIFICKFIPPTKAINGENLTTSTENGTINNEDKILLKKYNLKTNGDIILIKCPPTNDSKYQNYTLLDDELNDGYYNFDDNNTKFRWYVIERRNNNSALNFYCKQKSEQLIDGNFSWTIKIIWKKSKDYLKNTLFVNRNELIKMCKSSNVTQISYIIINSKLIKDCKNLDQIYKNQLIYKFNFTKNIKNDCIIPDKILKLYIEAPKIIIEDEIKLNISKELNFFYIKKNLEKNNFKVKLKEYNVVSNFYFKEDVNFSIGIYDTNRTLIFSESKKLNHNTLEVIGYKIYQLSYFCDKCQEGNNIIIKKTYFFGSNKTITINNITNYKNEELSYKANCSRNLYNYAYLEKASFNDIQVDINNDSKLISTQPEQFSISNSHLTITTKNPHGILICYYKTPTSYIIINNNYNIIFKLGKNKIKIDDDNLPIKDVNELYTNPKQSNSYKYTLILIFSLSSIIFLILLIIYCVKKDAIKKWIKRKKMRKKYPNIYKWWDILKISKPSMYGEVILDGNFYKNHIKNCVKRQIIYGCDTIQQLKEINTNNNAVKSQNNLSSTIMASYIELENIKSNFIISNYPTEDEFPQFWSMIYDEDITSIVAIIYDNVQSKIKNFPYYFKIEKASYDNYEIRLIKIKKTIFPTINVITYSISVDNKNHKIVNIYHVYEWMENSLLETSIEIDKLYKHIVESNVKPIILVHSQVSPCSRVYSFIYYGTILETFEKNKNICDPMIIIKDIRKQRNGGFISIQDYNVIMFNLVNYWIEKELLITRHFYTSYVEEYSKYRFDERRYETNFSSNCRPFLSFAIKLNINYVYEILQQSQHIYNLDTKIIKNKCKRFYQIQNDKNLNVKNRFSNIPCYDFKSINYDKIKHFRNCIDGYYHGNILQYKTGNGLERSIIMCQSPCKNTINDFISLIYNYNVGSIAMLCSEEEENKLWVRYLPNNVNESQNYNEYCINKLENLKNNDFFGSNYSIEKNNGTEKKFSNIHFKEWNSSGIPKNFVNLHKFYKILMENNSKQPILIHCPTGTTRTGTLALIIHIIDNINEFHSFNPLNNLAIIRKHRFGAVPGIDQFMLSLAIVYEHYKQELIKSEQPIYQKFLEIHNLLLK